MERENEVSEFLVGEAGAELAIEEIARRIGERLRVEGDERLM